MFEFEYLETEVADLLGVTASRISQIVTAIIKPAIESAYIRQETLDLYRDDPEYSKLAVNWIRL